jgi:hypothetical protein
MARALKLPAPNLTYFDQKRANFMQHRGGGETGSVGHSSGIPALRSPAK